MQIIKDQNRSEAFRYLSRKIAEKAKDASAEKIAEILEKQSADCSVFACSEENTAGAALYNAESAEIILVRAENEEVYAKLLEAVLKDASLHHTAAVRAPWEKNTSAVLEACGFLKEKDEDRAVCFLQKEMLGKTVTVVIDRPYGSLHPHIGDLECPYNFGYTEDSLQSGDFQDCYVIGPKQPLERFTGVCSGIVYRQETGSSRWIVTPLSEVISHEEIIRLIGEEEQYYSTRIIWA